MPDSEQKIQTAAPPPSAPSPNTPWNDLAAESLSSAATAAPPEPSFEADWDGPIHQPFADGAASTDPGDSTPASTPETHAYAVHPPSEYSPLSPTPSPHQERAINQTLARLERNSLEVKLYLDSIEEKISRMEPRLDQLQIDPLQIDHLQMDQLQPDPLEINQLHPDHFEQAQPTSDSHLPGPAPIPSSDTSPRNPSPAAAPFAPQITLPTVSTTERRRRRLDLPIDGSSNTLDDRDLAPGSPHSSNPLSDEAPFAFLPWLLARRRQLAVVAAVVIAFVTILAFTGKPRTPSPAAAALPPGTPAPAPTYIVTPSKSSAAIPSSDPASTEAFPQAPRSPSGTPASNSAAAGSQIVTSASPEGSGAISSPADFTSPSSAEPAPRALTTGTAADRAADRTPERTPDRTSDRSLPRIVPASGRIRVSSGVMAGNLVYSPSPRYPGGLASLFHTQGEVTLQAIIARSGRVQNLRVLSGHRLLRGAAEDAVRTWRYRPYLINGTPVEVATIITVEFHR